MESINRYFIGLDAIEGSSDTSIVVSEFLTDRTNGYGKLFMADPMSTFVFNGTIINGKMNGPGLITYLNSPIRTYEGILLDNLYHDKGTITYSNGDIFIGQFQNGLKHGPGNIFNSNGDLIMNNIWKNDIICGKVEYNECYPNTTILKITGMLYNSIKIGPWIYYRPDSTINNIEFYSDVLIDDTKKYDDLIVTDSDDLKFEEILHSNIEFNSNGRLSIIC